MFKNQREDHRILYIIISGLTIVTLIVTVALLTQNMQRNAQNELIGALELEHGLGVFFTNIQDIESGQKGYLLTGDSTYLKNYNLSISKIETSLNQVINKLEQADVDPSRISNLTHLIKEKIEELKSSSQLMSIDGRYTATEIKRKGVGKNLTETIREEVDKIYEEQSENIAKGKAKEAKYVMFSRAFTIIGTIIIFGMAILVFAIVRPLIQQLYKSREREQANNKLLAEKNEQLEHFAFIASHDLKEPIRSIRGFIQALKEDYGEQLDDDGQQYISFIEKAGARMSNLIDGLLRYSRLGRASNPTKVNLRSILKGIKKDLEALTTEKSAQIIAKELPEIVCMKTEMRQLFQNLIHNAIKFAAKDRPPVITISAKEKPDEWEFCVSDNGIGIEEKNKAEIFKMLTKVHHESEYSGQGLGLAFCKKIVEQHKGRIWVESELGAGSQFFFTVSKSLES